jgi:S1-C subfamily serine protease
VPLEEDAKQELGLAASARGVLVANVKQKSKAYIGGLRPYDLITEINGKEITTLIDFYHAVNSSDTNEYKIGFIREGNKYFVGLTKYPFIFTDPGVSC